ncbi:hypothetical protein FOZ61_000454 [Perkinsus olseni]|uniref:Uncharacterized protein n=1 Tax=Perkinsus olseni TaxID=32597 RepID=A0A7J6LZX4_PEROL|nr:hypothetical protein FOZ61_000454 [Perkinsus olseni]
MTLLSKLVVIFCIIAIGAVLRTTGGVEAWELTPEEEDRRNALQWRGIFVEPNRWGSCRIREIGIGHDYFTVSTFDFDVEVKKAPSRSCLRMTKANPIYCEFWWEKRDKQRNIFAMNGLVIDGGKGFGSEKLYMLGEGFGVLPLKHIPQEAEQLLKRTRSLGENTGSRPKKRRVIALYGHGVGLAPTRSGCKLEERSSDSAISASTFFFNLDSEEGVTAVGYEDRQIYYLFDKRRDIFTSPYREIEKGHPEGKWKIVEEEVPVLPLWYLPVGIQQMLKRTHPNGRACLKIVEATVNNPPPDFEEYKNKGYWITEFYRRTKDTIERAFTRMFVNHGLGYL